MWIGLVMSMIGDPPRAMYKALEMEWCHGVARGSPRWPCPQRRQTTWRPAIAKEMLKGETCRGCMRVDQHRKF
jgi:hypothetical protein